VATFPRSVSVVIPTYNYARFLGRAIESVMAQTVAPIEIIVVDDGSTDETPEVLARYANHVTALRRMNSGVASARNAGISVANGDLVAFLDSDDVWRPTKLERQLELQARYPECGAVGCGVEVVDAAGSTLRILEFKDATGSPRERLRAFALRQRWVGGSSSGALIPRHVLASVGGFDATLEAAEDWDLWLRIGVDYPVRNVPEPLTQVWDHRSGTFRNAERMARWQYQVLANLQARQADLLDGTTARRVRGMIEGDAAGECYGAGAWADSARHSALSIAAWPFEAQTWRLLLGSAVRSVLA
jgi:glycosyltransferase involved in cell wall biosynthesis